MPSPSTHQITFAASDELLDALDREAFRGDQSRAATIRSILAEHLRDVGMLKRSAPTTLHQGQSNPYFGPRGGR